MVETQEKSLERFFIACFFSFFTAWKGKETVCLGKRIFFVGKDFLAEHLKSHGTALADTAVFGCFYFEFRLVKCAS